MENGILMQEDISNLIPTKEQMLVIKTVELQTIVDNIERLLKKKVITKEIKTQIYKDAVFKAFKKAMPNIYKSMFENPSVLGEESRNN